MIVTKGNHEKQTKTVHTVNNDDSQTLQQQETQQETYSHHDKRENSNYDSSASTMKTLQENTNNAKNKDKQTSSESSSSSSPCAVMGIHGVRLKHFEKVMTAILPQVLDSLHYVQLPQSNNDNSLNHNDNNNNAMTQKNYLFDNDSIFRVYGTNKGQLSNYNRALKKEQQVNSLFQCIQFLLSSAANDKEITTTTTIVDFGGGTGHLAIPLAMYYNNNNNNNNNVRVILVDFKKKSVELLHQKIATIAKQDNNNNDTDATHNCNNKTTSIKSLVLQQCAGISNLYTFFGSIEEFFETYYFNNNEKQDRQDEIHSFNSSLSLSKWIGVALHLCGEATDVMLKYCSQYNFDGLVVAPCCVGKLSNQARDPYVYQATKQNSRTVQYPQSNLYRQILSKNDNNNNNNIDWDALAKAGDYNSHVTATTTTPRNATRRIAKALLEYDRCLTLKEGFNYTTFLTRMVPWEASTKNDIIVAWKDNDNVDGGGGNGTLTIPNVCQLCNEDIIYTQQHLLDPDIVVVATDPNNDNNNKVNDLPKKESATVVDRVDWTIQEEEEMTNYLRQILDDNPMFTFPLGLSKKKRKLVHHVAAKLGLKSWSKGKKYAEKTVVVCHKSN